MLDQLQRLFAQLLAQAEAAGGLPQREHDPAWPSACEVGAPSPDGLIRWRPEACNPPLDFLGVETALEQQLHTDLKTYFGSHWSDNLDARYRDEPFSLLFLWNDRDADILRANIIGHALQKKHAREPLTVFFACIDDARFLSVDNESGAVVVETVGRKDHVKVAASLADFLAEVEVAYAPPADVS